ncbi:MAG: SH3 domain-containing protein [Fretibacterium sp.]|nr:SH3 domain-containing protein [Fretibacterium sp.]
MRWIILALSLGASITSIIHGVFMLFGSLSIGAGPVGLSAIWLASLPIISAISALIGGVVAFSGSRWGAFFLGLATVLCAFAPRDIWIYGGLYCVGALLCIFLRPQRNRVDYYYEDFDEDLKDLNGGEEEEDEDYGEMYERRMARGESGRAMRRQPLPNVSQSPGGVRRRTSKTCPYCGATVAIEHRFCPECGESLQVPPYAGVSGPGLSDSAPVPEPSGEMPQETAAEPVSPLKEFGSPQPETGAPVEESFSSPSFQSAPDVEPLNIVTPSSSYQQHPYQEREETNFIDPERPARNHKVFVHPEREKMELPRQPISVNPDASYQQFAQYTHRRRGKSRRRSFGRRVLSLLLLILAVGGALWFLLGLRKLPEGELPPEVQPISTIPVAEEKKKDVLVQPVTPKTPAAADVLPAFTPDRSPKRGVITRTNVNMRSDHTTSSKKVVTLKQNTRFDVLDSWSDQKYTWYRIRTQDQNREGWVRGDLLLLLGGGLPAGYTKALVGTFGKNKTEMTEKLGKPSKSTGNTMDWSGLRATFHGEEVSRLQLSNSQRELKNKLKVGMSQTALLQIMGYPSGISQGQMQYSEGGKTALTVQLSKNVIRSITVGF